MNILSKVTWQAMWKNKTRTFVTIIGVILSAAMFTAITTAAYSFWDFAVRGFEYEKGDFFVQFDYATAEQAASLRQESGIVHIAEFKTLGYYNAYDDVYPDGTFPLGAVDKTFLETMSIPITEGRLPENSSEIVLPEQFNYLRRYYEKEEIALGETVTLDLFTAMNDQEREYGIEDAAFQKTYTVVGFMENRNYVADSTGDFFSCMLTVADGSEGDVLWSRLYVKTGNPNDAYTLAKQPYGAEVLLYQDLLILYGAAGVSNVNLLIIGLAAVLVLVIMVASVGPISNAFSISVSERTRQFGLLSSIGATKKQIRQSVLFEALAVGSIAIPIGLGVGFGAVALLLRQYGEQVLALFSFSSDGGVAIYAASSWIAILAAILICAVTILISAWIPARRATKVTPLESIRQNNEYRARKKAVRVGVLTRKLLGLPGILAAKYYKTSRKKYRTTVASLSISLVLFISANYLCQGLLLMANAAHLDNYDIYCYSADAQNFMTMYDTVRYFEGVSQSVLEARTTQTAVFDNDDLKDDYKKVLESGHYNITFSDGDWSAVYIYVIYMEDAAFEAHLRSEGIDPTPYLSGDAPMAVTMKQSVGGHMVQNERGEWEQMIFYDCPLEDSAESILVCDLELPDELRDESWEIITLETGATADGKPVLSIEVLPVGDDGVISIYGQTVAEFVVEPTDEIVDGKTVCNYYAYDSKTGKQGGTILATYPNEIQYIQVGECLDTTPFGIENNSSNQLTLIMPLSRMNEEFATDHNRFSLRMKVDDRDAVLAALSAFREDHTRFLYDDLTAEQQNARGIVSLARILSTGFIILITLISATNVFNTISTNIALRRRDFGMLRSVGFRTRDIYGMMIYECLNYGVRTFLWSMPFVLVLCTLIYQIIAARYMTSFVFPWDVTLPGMAMILVLVFVTMLYGIAKLRKDNPIDAIRIENT